MKIEQKLWEKKFFQLQSMSNVIRCIAQRFASKISGISCLALIFNISNQWMTILQAKKRFQVTRNHDSCTIFLVKLMQIYGSVEKASHSESGELGSIPEGCWNPLQPLGHFAWLWASQCTETCACCALYNFFLLDVVSGDLALTGF